MPTINTVVLICYLWPILHLGHHQLISSRNNYEQKTYAERGVNGNGHLAASNWFVGFLQPGEEPPDVQWIHNVNGKTNLEKELRNVDDEGSTSASNTRTIVVGDVYLRKSPNRIPEMAVQPKRNESLTLKQWLRIVISSQQYIESSQQKCVQLNLHATNIVEPALQYLLAVRYDLKVPVILHANIQSEPYSFREVVDPYIFVQSVAKLLPNAIISVGWAPHTGYKDDPLVSASDELYANSWYKPNKKFTWRMIFDMVENVYEVKQPVIFRCRAHLASYSLHQLLWLSKIRADFHLAIWSYEKDNIENWPGLIALRKYIPGGKIFYDLHPTHGKEFYDNYDILQKGVYLEERPWNRHHWRVIQFVNPTALLSTVVLSDEAVGFFGWPSAFLLSKTVAKRGFTQSVRGKVLFVPKENYLDVNPLEKTGFSVYLLDSIEDIASPDITTGIRALISSDGQISIENRNVYREYDAKNRRFVRINKIVSRKSYSQLQLYDCYGFSLVDSLTVVRFTVYPTKCSGSDTPTPNSSYGRTISLDVPAPGKSGTRYVLVQKTGDATIDCLVEDLYHKNQAPGASISSNNFASVVFNSQIVVVVIVLQRIIALYVYF